MNKMKRLHILTLFAVSAFGQTSTLTPCVTHIPPGRHTDYIWPLNHLPRTIDAWPSCKPPANIIGYDYDEDGDDIPDPGHTTVQFSKRFGIMFSFQTKHKHWFVPAHFLFRIGSMRYDFVDHYYIWPFTLRANVKKD